MVLKMKPDIKLDMEGDEDTGAIIIFALRYCVGRRSYAPSLVIEWVKRHWNVISPLDQAIIYRDLKDDFGSEREMGDDCDLARWLEFRDWIESKIKASPQAAN